MRRSTLLTLLLLLSLAPSLLAHDMFFKLTSYFVAPRQHLAITLLNGTFSTSENYITRDRLRDVALVAGGKRVRIDTANWNPGGDGKSSVVTIDVGAPGTYVLGASTRPRELALPGKEFNAYLKDEGLADMLERRTREGELGKRTNERYHKHVKAVFQVGDARTDDFATVLGYPAEIVPVTNPYAARVGAQLAFRCLVDGTPAANLPLLAGGRSPSGARIAVQSVRTDARGEGRITLTQPGIWYVKFISMEKADHDGLTHESKWATLTFGVR
jgi:hypothetical protein